MTKKAAPAIHGTEWKKVLLCLGLILASLTGCTREPENVAAAKDAVKLYNRTLVESYRRVKPELMEYITTPKESGRVSMFMLYNLTDKKQTMESEIKEIKFENVDLDAKERTARVKTRESWTFFYRSSETGEQSSEKQAISYESSYRLVKAEGRWLVDELRTKVTKGPETISAQER